VTFAVLAPWTTGQDKKEPERGELAEALQGADTVFTATIVKAIPVAQTNSIPPSIRGDVTFKEVKAIEASPRDPPSRTPSERGAPRT